MRIGSAQRLCRGRASGSGREVLTAPESNSDAIAEAKTAAKMASKRRPPKWQLRRVKMANNLATNMATQTATNMVENIMANMATRMVAKMATKTAAKMATNMMA